MEKTWKKTAFFPGDPDVSQIFFSLRGPRRPFRVIRNALWVFPRPRQVTCKICRRYGYMYIAFKQSVYVNIYILYIHLSISTSCVMRFLCKTYIDLYVFVPIFLRHQKKSTKCGLYFFLTDWFVSNTPLIDTHSDWHMLA